MATSHDPTSRNDGERSDFSDSDLLWFDRLAGRSAGPAQHPAQHDADELRRVLDAEAAWQASQSGPETRRRADMLRQQLAAQLLADGAAAAAHVNDETTAPAAPPWWQRWRNALFGDTSTASPWPARWTGAAALGGIAALTVALLPQLDAWRDPGGVGLQPAQVLMGGGSGTDARVQTRPTRTPRRDAEAFAAALRASPTAAQPGLYSDPLGDAKVVIVEVELEGSQLASAGAVFEANGLRRPVRVGLARVEFGR